jgi:transposase-like protein
MGQNRRKFSPELRNRILQQIESGQIGASQAARQYQVSRSLIEYWRKRHREGQLEDQSTPRERQLERENRELKAKVGELVMQMEHLKKLQHSVRLRKAPIHPSSPHPTWISFERVPSDWAGTQQLLLPGKRSAGVHDGSGFMQSDR